jgi:hypothetical protein
MKKLLILIAVFTLSIGPFAQHDGMAHNNGNSSSGFSTTEILLGIIVIGLLVGGLVWFVNNSRKAK